MKHKAYRYFSIGEHEKEELWLNEMSSKGMHLSDTAGIRYMFQEGEPGAYIYRIELLKNMPNHVESVSYIRFLEETGVEFVGSYGRWAYFRRPASLGAFELYSDTDSKIKHFRRILTMADVLSILFAAWMPLWFWHAWPQLQISRNWFYTGHDFYSLPTVCVFALLAILFQLVVIPVRKSLHRLRTQKKLGE
jgi:hypothetical protein